MKLNLLAAALFLALAVFGQSAFGQNAIPESKKKLIAEVVTLTKMEEQFGKIVNEMMAEMEKTYPRMIDDIVDANPDLTPELRSEIKSTAGKSYVSFSKRLRERLAAEFDYSAYIKEAIYPLYDKFFTEDDLKALAAFYETPAGKKLTDNMPEFAAESMRLSNEFFLPKLLPMIDELLQEELKNLESPPPPKLKGE